MYTLCTFDASRQTNKYLQVRTIKDTRFTIMIMNNQFSYKANCVTVTYE